MKFYTAPGSTLSHVLKAAALKANAIQMGTPDNPLIFAGVSGGSPNQVIERGVMDNLVSLLLCNIFGSILDSTKYLWVARTKVISLQMYN